ncbi:MAG: hypothetical protein HYX67_06000 [Candidatus Melainabacteria bacterium]|nr:hypothetical protein [Candidatus Melainabacteria bacterium]
MWIRDGVLIDRMHINAVAFAYAVQLSSNQTTEPKASLSKLIYFAFEKSGLSCAEKVALYNAECQSIVPVESAVQLYNAIATDAANEAHYFDGAIELLNDLKSGGNANMITSALEQELLDSWVVGSQGRHIAGCLDAVLGKRGDFTKGRAHFQYVSKLGYQTIYYVADAVFEISTSANLAREFNIVPIGFGNEITRATVFEAVQIVSATVRRLTEELNLSERGGRMVESLTKDLDYWNTTLVDPKTDPKLLADAGAAVVVEGDKGTLMLQLRQYFESQNLLGAD